MNAAQPLSIETAGKYVEKEENRQFGNDASYESVRRLLIKIAARCMGRVTAMGGLGMTMDDVMQEMNLSYIQARNGWSPEGGAKFSTYLVNTCYWNFNSCIKRRETERRLMGMVNLSDMRPGGTAHDDDQDYMEVYGADCTEISVTLLVPGLNQGMELIEGTADTEELEAHMGVNPELLIEQRQNAKENLRAISSLTKEARAFAVELLKAASSNEDLPTIRDFASRQGMGPTAVRRMRVELSNRFGVKC